jgi:hypothetical protein
MQSGRWKGPDSNVHAADFAPNDADVAAQAMQKHPFGYIACELFMAKTRKYFRGVKYGSGVYGLVMELMTMCAEGKISSIQLAAGVKGALREHPRVLNALSHLLRDIHAIINSVRSNIHADNSSSDRVLYDFKK